MPQYVNYRIFSFNYIFSGYNINKIMSIRVTVTEEVIGLIHKEQN